MLKKQSGLGRGLSALLNPQLLSENKDSNDDEPALDLPLVSNQDSDYNQHRDVMAAKLQHSQNKLSEVSQVFTEQISLHTSQSDQDRILNIDIHLLEAMKHQPRQNFDDTTLLELSESIKNYGILQPLIVCKIVETVGQNSGSKYRIVAGERRFRAAHLAGLHELPCIVRDFETHTQLEVALIENIQREELSPVDEAKAYSRLFQEYNYTQEQLSSKLGKDRTTISNALRLLTLPEIIQNDLIAKTLSAGHAKALCGIEDMRSQLKIREQILAKKLSVRQTEELVKNWKKNKGQQKLLKDTLPPDLRFTCEQFKGYLGTKVKLSGNAEKGKIEISYFSSEDLERISQLVLRSPLG